MNWLKIVASRRQLILVMPLICGLAGCVQTKVQSHPGRSDTGMEVRTSSGNASPTNVPPPFNGRNAIDVADPLGAAMQDLCGPLLEYYFQYRHGPANVSELQQFADPDQKLQLTCPKSGKPYVCVPDGLMNSSKPHLRIYIYDPEPHNGYRWCAVWKENTGKDQSLLMYADNFPEAEFRNFTPAREHVLIP